MNYILSMSKTLNETGFYTEPELLLEVYGHILDLPEQKSGTTLVAKQ